MIEELIDAFKNNENLKGVYENLFTLIQDQTVELEGNPINVSFADKYYYITYQTSTKVNPAKKKTYYHKTGRGYNYDSVLGLRTALILYYLSSEEVTDETIDIKLNQIVNLASDAGITLNKRIMNQFKNWKKRVKKNGVSFILSNNEFSLKGPVKMISKSNNP